NRTRRTCAMWALRESRGPSSFSPRPCARAGLQATAAERSSTNRQTTLDAPIYHLRTSDKDPGRRSVSGSWSCGQHLTAAGVAAARTTAARGAGPPGLRPRWCGEGPRQYNAGAGLSGRKAMKIARRPAIVTAALLLVWAAEVHAQAWG